MKKILLSFVVSLLFVLTASAQRPVFVTDSDNFIKIQKAVHLPSSAGITVQDFDMTQRSGKYFYVVSAAVSGTVKTATSTTPAIKAMLRYSWDNVQYTTLDSVLFTGTVKDTSMVFSGASSSVLYPYLKIYVGGVDSLTATVDDIYLRITKE